MDDKLSNLDTIPSIDRTTDLLYVVDMPSGVSYKVTPNQALGFTGGNPVSTTDTQTLTNKTLTSPTINTPALTVNDNALTIQDNSDTTKKAVFELSGISAGTTRTYTLPNRSDTLVDLGSSQTLTSKTLTAPTITNPTLTVDTISEFTSANGVTIDGLNIKDGALNTNNSVPNNAWNNTGSFGSSWAWTTWTPTLSGRFNNTKWAKASKYTIVGKTVICKLSLTANSATPMDGGVADALFTLPVTSTALANTGNIQLLGTVNAFVTSIYPLYVGLASTTVGLLRPWLSNSTYVTADLVTSAVPNTWASGSEISGTFVYEMA